MRSGLLELCPRLHSALLILDAELDQVYLASEATRRSKLITGFIRVAQHALPSSETASTPAATAAPV